MNDQTTVQLSPHIVNRGTYPRTTTAGIVSLFRGMQMYVWRHTQWPNLSGDVLELADALGDGVGCMLSLRVLLPLSQSIGLPPCSSFCAKLASASALYMATWSYRCRTAHAQRLPHKQLGARPHEHLLCRAHHHHARGLHSQNPRSLEHGV
jgi:hypothetical protein